MSYPILYQPKETEFWTNGIGILSDCISCFVSEELNGSFELEMQYPVTGIHYSYIQCSCIVKAKSVQDGNPQLFRIYSVSKPISGIVTILAQHISYDLTGIPVSIFTARDVKSALQGLSTHAVVDCPFTFITDKEDVADFSVSVPRSIRSSLGGDDGSILDVYGGEFEFDNFNVILHDVRGFDMGVYIRYGKNLTSIKQDINCANVITGVYPYWVNDETGAIVELPEKIVEVYGKHPVGSEPLRITRIMTLDISSEFEEQPTETDMRFYVNSLTDYCLSPEVSLSVSFRQLNEIFGTDEKIQFDHVSLGDEVHVEFPALGVSSVARVVELIYDVILDRVERITLGNMRGKLTDTVAGLQKYVGYKSKKRGVVE